MFEKLRGPFKRLIEPIAQGLVHIGISADAVTVIGAVGTIVASIATGITGWLFPGVVVLTILVIFDSLDGSVAAITTGGTQFGAFLDSTLDRIADWAVLVGVILFFILHNNWLTNSSEATLNTVYCWIGIGGALYSIMTSFVTSYARARAQAVGFEAKNGIATRSDRLVIILVGMGLAGLTNQIVILVFALLLLSVLGTVTVIQRIVEVKNQMNSMTVLTETTTAETQATEAQPITSSPPSNSAESPETEPHAVLYK